MKKLVIATYLAVASIAATAADTYVELGYTQLTYKLPEFFGYSLQAKPKLVDALVGVELHEFLALEGILGLGLGDASLKLDGQVIGAQIEIDDVFGVFLKPKVQVNKNLEFFGRVGMVQIKQFIHGAGLSASDSDSDIAYGFGVNFYINEATYITANYMKLYDKDDVTIAGPTIGVGFRF